MSSIVFIQENASEPKIIPTEPPKNLVIEFPPNFDLQELGSRARNDQGKSTRKPPNAFILFRKKYLDALHRLGQRIPMKNVSGWARDAWNQLPQHQKQEYEDIATKAASLYQEWAPVTPSRRPPNRSQPSKKRQNRPKPQQPIETVPVTQPPTLPAAPTTPLPPPPHSFVVEGPTDEVVSPILYTPIAEESNFVDSEAQICTYESPISFSCI